MPMGFAELSAEFLETVLSRRAGRAVAVLEVAARDHADRPDRRRLTVRTDAGDLELYVKVFSHDRRDEARTWAFLDQAGGLPLPALYHAEFDQRIGSYGVIVEYLPPLAETGAWDDSQCRRLAAALAAVHGRFWGRTDALPDFLAAAPTQPGATVEPAVRRFIDRLAPPDQALLYADLPDAMTLLVKLLRLPPAFFAEPDDIPSTLIHGALGPADVLFRPHGAGPLPLLAGWGAARIGRGTEDLASLLDALPPQRRDAAREAMLAGYLEGLAEAGASAPADRIADDLDRRRVLRGCRALPARCRKYLDRLGRPGHEAWCRDFVRRAAVETAQWRRILSARVRAAGLDEPEKDYPPPPPLV